MSCCSKQKGGGGFDVFCPLCNLPFYSPFEADKPPSDDDEDADLYDLRNTKLDWLSDVLGFDENTHAVMELESSNAYGEFPIKKGKDKGGLFGLKTNFSVKEGIKRKEEYAGFGFAFHKDCIKYISKKSGRPLTYQLAVDAEHKIEDYFKANPDMRRDNEYQQQRYDFDQALEDEGPDFFISPVESNGKKIQHLLDDFIPSKRVATPPKAAATPEKKSSQSRRAHDDDDDAACSSQKDKVICIKKKKCVWGKTNRCSKKRSTRKQTKSNTKTNAHHSCPSHKNKDECVRNNCIWGKTNRCSKKRVSK